MAKENAPSIIYDELDTLVPSRDNSSKPYEHKCSN